VIRAVIAGRANSLLSYGAAGIVDHHGNLVVEAPLLVDVLVVADLDVATRVQPPSVLPAWAGTRL